MKYPTLFATLLAFLLALPLTADTTTSDEEAATAKTLSGDATTGAADETATDTASYELKYRFKPGETIRYRVEHRATVDTKIEGNRDVSKSRSVSTKLWEVSSVEGDIITFRFLIEGVDMWQKSDGRDEVRYNSATSEGEIPTQYQQVASTVGKTLAIVTVNDSGVVMKREQGKSNPDLGFGGIIFPLPKGAVPIGYTWSQSKTLKLNQRDGRVKQVNVQVKHKLEEVRRNVAKISIRTEVLTPITSAALKSQLVQQLSNGEVRFDIDKGRVISKELNWDETVIGFNGAASNMKYLAKFTESLITESRTAKAGANRRK